MVIALNHPASGVTLSGLIVCAAAWLPVSEARADEVRAEAAERSRDAAGRTDECECPASDTEHAVVVSAVEHGQWDRLVRSHSGPRPTSDACAPHKFDPVGRIPAARFAAMTVASHPLAAGAAYQTLGTWPHAPPRSDHR